MHGSRRHRSGRTTIPTAALLLTLGALAGCGPTDEARRAQPVAPNLLFEHPPAGLLDTESFHRNSMLRSAHLTAPDGGEDWKLTQGARTTAGACGDSRAGALALSSTFTADLLTATELEVIAGDLRGNYIELEWFDGTAADRLRRRERVHWNDAGGAGHDRFRFDLARVPERREGDRVVLRTRSDRTRRSCLQAISWNRSVLDPDLLLAAGARAGRLALGSEVRDARLAADVEPIEIELTGGSDPGHLELTFGVWGQPQAPVSFEVELVDDGGEIAARSAAVVPPGESDRWHHLELPLSSEPAPGTHLRLSTTGCQPAAQRDCVAVWSEVRPARRRPAPGAPLPDILLISIDTLRADRMSLYGAQRQTTPAIDLWSRRHAVVFDSAMAAAGWTLPSHFSMLTGQDVQRHQALLAEPVPEGPAVIAEVLRAGGYRTRAIVGGGYLDPRFGFHRGFDVYSSWQGATAGHHEIEWGIGEALRALDAIDEQPQFLFFHTYEVHPPLRYRESCPAERAGIDLSTRLTIQELPEEERNERGEGSRWMVATAGHPEQRRALPDELRELPYELYDCGVASADRWLGRLLTAVERRRVERPMLVILTSDHGESLGEHGLAGHGLLYEDNLRVPLVISLPDRSGAGKRIASPVRLVDIVPTILDVVGRPQLEAVDGRSLLPLAHGPEDALDSAPATAYSDHLGLALRADERTKFLFWDHLDPQRERKDRLFDLVSDPGERNDLLPSRLDRAGRDELNELKARALRALATSPGLRIRIPANPDLGEMTLSAPWLTAANVRWIGPPQPEVRFDAHGSIVISGPVLQEVALNAIVTADALASLQLRASTRDAPGSPVEIALPVDLLAPTPLRIGFDGQRFSSRRGPAAAAPAWLELEPRGVRSARRPAPQAQDEALRDSLRQLGYLQ